MVSVEILNVIIEGVDPFDKFVVLVIGIEDLMDFRFVKIDAFLDDMHLIEGFEMNGFDLLDE